MKIRAAKMFRERMNKYRLVPQSGSSRMEGGQSPFTPQIDLEEGGFF